MPRLLARLSAALPLVALLVLARPLAAQQAPAVPPIVTAGLAEYAKSGLRPALAVWLVGSPVNNAATVEQMVASLAPIEAAYGRMTGHDVLRVVPIGTRVRRVYVVMRYEQGPVYAWFECYEAASGWIIPSFLTHTRATEIFPPDLLATGR